MCAWDAEVRKQKTSVPQNWTPLRIIVGISAGGYCSRVKGVVNSHSTVHTWSTEHHRHTEIYKTLLLKEYSVQQVELLCRPAGLTAKPQVMFHRPTAHLCIGKCLMQSQQNDLRDLSGTQLQIPTTLISCDRRRNHTQKNDLEEKNIFIFVMKNTFGLFEAKVPKRVYPQSYSDWENKNENKWKFFTDRRMSHSNLFV